MMNSGYVYNTVLECKSRARGNDEDKEMTKKNVFKFPTAVGTSDLLEGKKS